MKPNTSRYANSERYVVCIGFLYDNSASFYPFIASAFQSMTTRVHRFLNIPVSNVFIKKLEEYNAIFGQKQIQNIHFTLSLIENKPKYDKLESLIQNNIEKCMDWCERYSLPYNVMNVPTNIFLDSES
jgi:hypothetical protein